MTATLLTIEDLCRLTGLTRRMVCKRVRAGQLPEPVVTGSSPCYWRWTPKAIEQGILEAPPRFRGVRHEALMRAAVKPDPPRLKSGKKLSGFELAREVIRQSERK